MTSPRYIDLTGQCFGQLTVIRRAANRDGEGANFLCNCSCGQTCVVAGISLRQGRTVRCPVCQERYRAIGKVARQRVDQDPGALYEEWMIKQRADRLAWNKVKRDAERMALFETIERAQLAADTVQAKQLLDTLTPTARHRYMRWRMARLITVSQTGTH